MGLLDKLSALANDVSKKAQEVEINVSKDATKVIRGIQSKTSNSYERLSNTVVSYIKSLVKQVDLNSMLQKIDEEGKEKHIDVSALKKFIKEIQDFVKDDKSIRENK